jgi:hypothetical protein
MVAIWTQLKLSMTLVTTIYVFRKIVGILDVLSSRTTGERVNIKG